MNFNTMVSPNSRLELTANLNSDNLDLKCQKPTTTRQRRRRLSELPGVEFECKMVRNSRENQSQIAITRSTSMVISTRRKTANQTTVRLILFEVFALIALNSLLSQISYVTDEVHPHQYHHHHNHHHIHHHPHKTDDKPHHQPQSFLSSFLIRAKLPTIILAAAAECQTESDCPTDKVCHENKCICSREKPIELEPDRCLPRTLIEEQCVIGEQCLGNSDCLDGYCSCGNDAVSLFNPSAKIYYCHKKSGLNEQCNHDLQCPDNAYCSTKNSGCLCQNGFAESLFNSEGKESRICLPKFCKSSDACESEFHECDDNKCKCLAAHFDPTTARCYKYGSTGGQSEDDLEGKNGTSNGEDILDKNNDANNSIYSIIKDLTENSDKIWFVLLFLISLSIITLVLILILVRKYYVGFCWTTHKQEYEPNNKNPQKNGYFDKNSINNKSFRRKNGESDDGDGDDTHADRSNLVPDLHKNHNRKSNDHHIKINMNDKGDENHHYVTPLSTSTSTPV